jgi:5'-phosphate synthase pdxT subunit
MARIGVLALQGDFAAHAAALGRVGVTAREVRRPAELGDLDGLVLPGGESTALLHLMRDEPWFEELRRFTARGGAVLATCAGAVLLSREVRPEQASVGLLDVVVERNAYGRQLDSFEAEIDVAGFDRPLRAAFIRAPRFLAVGPAVEVLARREGAPVLVRQGRILAATFHSEITQDDRLHGRFVQLVDEVPPVALASVHSATVEGGCSC